MQMNKISSQDYCRNFVRDANYNLYLLHFFVPREKRRAILSIMALHCDLRAIPQKVQDPMMRLIRLKWWSDEIEKINNGEPFADSPVLQEIDETYPKTIQWDSYFDRFNQSLRGETVDIDESLYEIFGQIINDEKLNNRFSKRLALHDEMDDSVYFRAFRLWLGI